MGRTTWIYDHFDLYLTPVTLTFNLPEKCFKWHFSFSRTITVQNYFWNPCINVQVMVRTSSYMTILTFIWPLWPWPSTYLKKMFQMALFLLKGKNCAKLFLKSMHKCTSYGPDKLNIWPLWPLFDPWDHDLQPTWKSVSNGISPPRGQQLCKIILKSTHKCTSYAPVKLNPCIWPFWPLFDPCDLDLQLPKNVSNSTSRPQGPELCQIVLKSMHYCTSYGPDKFGRTHVRTDARTHARTYTELKL